MIPWSMWRELIVLLCTEDIRKFDYEVRTEIAFDDAGLEFLLIVKMNHVESVAWFEVFRLIILKVWS